MSGELYAEIAELEKERDELKSANVGLRADLALAHADTVKRALVQMQSQNDELRAVLRALWAWALPDPALSVDTIAAVEKALGER